jgi:hypothetical protein
MNKKQVIKFISKFNLKYKIIIKYISSKEIDDYDAFVSLEDNNYFIFLNRKLFLYNNNINELKAIIMHEIGHIETNKMFKYRKESLNEYEAHRWALKTSYKYKYFKIFNELVEYLNDWYETSYNEDNGRYRVYIKAAILLKKYLKNNRKLVYPAK